MLNQVTGVLSYHSEWAEDVNPYALEACWRLGKWEDFESQSKKVHSGRFEVKLGSLLFAARKDDELRFRGLLESIRGDLTVSIAAASMESYRRCYDSVLQLHMLHEVESAFKVLKKADPASVSDKFEKMTSFWNSRFKLAIQSFKITEPILSLRRLVLASLCVHFTQAFGSCESQPAFFRSTNVGQAGLVRQMQELQELEQGKLWLQSAKISRKSGHLQTSYGALLHAAELQEESVHLERAKWIWEKGQTHKAMYELQSAALRLREECESLQDVDAAALKEKKIILAKTELLHARWIHETSSGATNAILAQYSRVIREQPEYALITYRRETVLTLH